MDSFKHQHFILNKPYGYLSQFVNNQNKRSNKKLLGDLFSFPKDTMAIGRLDEKSEGLLLLTTDGKTSELIRSRKVEKEYYVQVDGLITQEAIDKIRRGIEISIPYKSNEDAKRVTKRYKTIPCSASFLEKTPQFPERGRRIRDDRHGPTSWISITIKEGKFRQIRKMTAAVGFPTLRLVRIRIGKIELKTMPFGKVIELQDIFTHFNDKN